MTSRLRTSRSHFVNEAVADRRYLTGECGDKDRDYLLPKHIYLTNTKRAKPSAILFAVQFFVVVYKYFYWSDDLIVFFEELAYLPRTSSLRELLDQVESESHYVE